MEAITTYFISPFLVTAFGVLLMAFTCPQHIYMIRNIIFISLKIKFQLTTDKKLT